ncbi:uncharacterized protein LOC127851488 isoform X2 [Dreissena polymorpha]|uniref:uncharacterized protein LOC127851488 isoform X2 n=1 Tax=Dreissena polymorpha TaxID=45954 RepID=UPI0022649487|nr:uncharacterized protein LOC127851488 isoform X2 [Dreissena polymorpha]
MGDAELDVDGMDIDAAFDWLEDRRISHQLHSLEEMKDFIRSYIHADANHVQNIMEFHHSNQTNLQKVLSTNYKLRNRIEGIYEELLNAFKRHPEWTDLSSYLFAWCGCDIVTKIQHNKSDLLRTDCTIIIAGETNAGKTSILNLLLGEDVLPVSRLFSTSTVCVVHPIGPEEDPYFTIEGDQKKHMGIQGQVVEKLKEILTCRSTNDNVKKIDVYWQVPALGLNKDVVFVDLPGTVDEKSKEHLLEYQSSSAAVIFVLNSANVEGVHKNTLLQTLIQVEGLDKTVGLFGVDSTSVMVVCNKWDVVEQMDREEEGTAKKVWDDACTMLQKYLPGFLSERQMYKMDTLKTLRYMKSGIGDTNVYIDFKRGLGELALECQNKRSYMHSRWLFSFVEHFENFISRKCDSSSNSSDKEITQLLQFITVKLEHLDTSLEETCKDTSIQDDRIGEMDVDAAFNWLEAKGISHQLNSVEEMRDLIRSTIRANNNKSRQPIYIKTMDGEDLQITLSKDREMRHTIRTLYKDMLNTIEKHPNFDDLKAYLSSFCGCDVIEKLSEHTNKLQHTDSPIVILGETSSGKSCFLNLILGEDVLPSGLLCTTATICVIHPIPPGEDPYFTIDEDETKHMGNKIDLIKELTAILTFRSDTDLCKQVHIYWQVPLLGLNNVVLVDTPGVGESEQMTAKLFEYIPNAAAFIYFINSANAGGVQEDKLVKIFEKVLEYDQSRDVFSFDPTCMLFVCNKWDVIEEREKNGEVGLQEKVWQDIKSKLHKYLPGYQWDTHVFRLSTAEAIRYMKSGIDAQTKFEELKVRLKTLIQQSQTSTCAMHYRFCG